MPFFAEKLFYGFSAVLLGAGIFVIQPAHNQDVSNFQSNIKNQFALAAGEVLDYHPMLDSVEFIVSGVNQFYQEAAISMTAILTPSGSMNGLNFVATSTYQRFASLFNQNLPKVAGISIIARQKEETLVIPPNFMQEDPVYNIVPQQSLNFAPANQAAIIPPAIPKETWMNITDTNTGQVYCVAIFNSEVNRYLGPCKNDYH